MKKPISILLAAILTGSLAMSGCSKAADSSTAKVDANAPVKLSITWWGSQSRHDYTKKFLKCILLKTQI